MSDLEEARIEDKNLLSIDELVAIGVKLFDSDQGFVSAAIDPESELGFILIDLEEPHEGIEAGLYGHCVGKVSEEALAQIQNFFLLRIGMDCGICDELTRYKIDNGTGPTLQ